MLSLILPLIALSAAPTQAAVQVCEADCFYLNANGSTLFFSGKVTALRNTATDAFYDLQTRQCDSGILLKRTLKSVQLMETPELNEINSRKTETDYGYDYSVTRSKERRRVYTLSRSELRANFETVEANEINSCRPARESDLPAHPQDSDGNDIVG